MFYLKYNWQTTSTNYVRVLQNSFLVQIIINIKIYLKASGSGVPSIMCLAQNWGACTPFNNISQNPYNYQLILNFVIIFLVIFHTENPSKQTVKGSMRMYQPAQKPARGQPIKRSPRNQTKDQKGFPPPEPSPPPAAILRAVRKLK